MTDDSTKDQPKSLDALHRQWLKTVEGRFLVLEEKPSALRQGSRQ